MSSQGFLDPIWSHPQQVSALLFNRQGDRLITACEDKLVRVFAAGTGQNAVAPLYAPIVHVVAKPPALLEQDRVLVTVSDRSELRRWDFATGRPVSTPIRTHAFLLQGVAASADGRWFATGGYNGPELYTAEGKERPVQQGHTNLVTQCAFSPDSSMLLSASWDSTARVWSLPHGQPIGPPIWHMTDVSLCAWSDDFRYVATAQRDGLIRVWQLPKDDHVLAKQAGWGERPRVSFDGRLVAPGIWHESPNSSDGHLNVPRLQVVATATGQPVGAGVSLAGALVEACCSGDNLGVAAVFSRGEKGMLGVWDVATSAPRFEPIELPGLPISVAARSKSEHLAVVCSTGDLIVVDDRTGKGSLRLRHERWTSKPNAGSAQVSYTPDGNSLISLGGGVGATINVRDAGTGQLRFAPLRAAVAGSNFRSFSISADSRLMATMALGKNEAQVWDVATGRALSKPLPHPGGQWGLFSVRFSPDGRVSSHWPQGRSGSLLGLASRQAGLPSHGESQ